MEDAPTDATTALNSATNNKLNLDDAIDSMQLYYIKPLTDQINHIKQNLN